MDAIQVLVISAKNIQCLLELGSKSSHSVSSCSRLSLRNKFNRRAGSRADMARTDEGGDIVKCIVSI